MRTSAVVLAGGSSRRMGGDIDKLMLTTAGLPLLIHALRAFETCPEVHEIVLVAREDRQSSYQALARAHGITKLATVTVGGAERQDSVWRGLESVSAGTEIVLIHDGARCLVTAEIISRCIEAARRDGAAIPATRVKDTIKRARADQRVESTVDRSQLWAAQTPQTFRLDLIRRAYAPLVRDRIVVTDDAAAVECLRHDVTLVEGDPFNLKITTPEDLLLAEIILSRRPAQV